MRQGLDRWAAAMKESVAMEYISVGQHVMNKLVSSGKIKRRLVGGQIRYLRSDLDEFLENCEDADSTKERQRRSRALKQRMNKDSLKAE